MAYQQKDNTGSVFVNDRKEKDTHPDRSGTAMIGGKEYWVSGWLKEANGKKFLSLAFKPKEQKREDSRPKQKQVEEVPFVDDDLPF